MTIEDLKIKLRNEFDRYQSYDMLDVSKCPFSWWTDLEPLWNLQPLCPASLDPRLQGHAALSLHLTIFETLMHSIVSARGR